MSWPRWLRSLSGAALGEDEPSLPRPVEGAAPGVAALVEGLPGDRSHSVLDLGPHCEANVETYSEFARWVRFAEITGSAPPAASRTELAARIPEPERPYELIFAWDALERTPPEGRGRLVERVAAVAAPGARLHAVVAAPDVETVHPFRFTLLEVGRMRYEPMGPAREGWPRLMGSRVEKVLEPFQVTRRFALKGGLLEYVASLPDGHGHVEEEPRREATG